MKCFSWFYNRIFTLILACGLIIFSPFALAQTKVGVVNVQKIMSTSTAAIEASKRIEQEFSARDQEMKRLSLKLQGMKEDFDKNQATLSESDKKRKEAEFADLNREFQRKGRELREDLERRQAEETGKLLEKTQAVIKIIAEAENYDLILRDAVYVAPAANITDQVLKELQ